MADALWLQDSIAMRSNSSLLNNSFNFFRKGTAAWQAPQPMPVKLISMTLLLQLASDKDCPSIFSNIHPGAFWPVSPDVDGESPLFLWRSLYLTVS